MTRPNDPRAAAAGALAEVTALRAEVARDGRALYARWRSQVARASFAPSALNFAHYLVLRRHDLRPLQRQLMQLGLSSLGRLEGRVLASLDAVANALAGLARVAAPCRPPTARQFFRGETLLAARADALFGPHHHGRAGRIMVTLPTEAGDDPGLVRDLARRGADVLRINCAHDDDCTWERMIAHGRAAAAEVGRPLPVMMDIAGPKVRTGRVLTPRERVRLHIGDLLLLTPEIRPALADIPFQATCTEASVFDSLAVDDEVSIDDGQLGGTVVGLSHGGFLVRISKGKLSGLKLLPDKGLNFPTTSLKLDPLTAKDRADLDFIALNADLVGHSFVESAGHVAALQDELAARRPDWQRLGLVGKIETPRAVANLPEIIIAAAGRQPFAVMIARGDLAVEMGFARVAEMQEEILWLAEAANVPVIWATQVLEELVKKGLPSRGEMTDAAMAARAECVMLNKGPNVAAAVDVLDRLLNRMGEHQLKKTPTLRALHSWPPAGKSS